MTPEFAAAAVARPVGELENAWSTGDGVLRRARALDVTAWAFYVGGRAGALGEDVRPETAVAALGTVAPDALTVGLATARRAGLVALATARLHECAAWGSTPGADPRLAHLLERVVTDADATGLPLFAATRALVAAVATVDPGGRAILLVHALAEHRAGAMVLAGRAVGLRPVEALLAGPDGEQEALALGWAPPFPPRLSLLRRYADAAAVADRIAGDAYAGLTAAERRELVARLTALRP